MSSYVTLPVPDGLDVISGLHFSGHRLLASSWDGQLLVYDAQAAILESQITLEVPALSISSVGSSTFVGLLDGTVRNVDYENNSTHTQYSTNGANSGINCLRPLLSSLLAGSFDGHVRLLDPRAATASSVISPHRRKLFSMDTASNHVVLACLDRQIEIYDPRNWISPLEVRESGLKHQVRTLRTLPLGDGYALASVDGRVSVEYFDPSPEVQSQRFAFKCHRQPGPAEDVVHPVNLLVFHPVHQTLFTAGLDGNVCLWNWHQRKRMKQYPQLPSWPLAVVSVDVDSTGSLLAVAASDDTYKNGRRGSIRQDSRLYIRKLGPSECAPKRKSVAGVEQVVVE